MLLLKLAGGAPRDEEQLDDESETDEESERVLTCAACAHVVAKRAAIFAAPGTTAPVQVFANPHGRVFEVLALRSVTGVRIVGEPTSDATWFRGYAWSVALCTSCLTHLGWRFDASAPDADPRTFFALIREAIREG